MTREAKLDKIVAELDELLAKASKRTPGEWVADIEEDQLLTAYIKCPSELNEEVACVYRTHSLQIINANENATFIAACAGPAEKGWILTKKWIALARFIGSEPMMDDIIKTWEEQL